MMRRRELLKGITTAALGMFVKPSFQKALAEEPDQQVKTVYVMFKCHLDVGFTDTEQGVIRTYFDNYLPRAMDTAEKLRGSGGEERYVWTIAAWMLYEYLEQASAEKRTRMEHAIAAEDIAWHAMPFTWNSEMLDRSLIASSLRISAALDQRFGKKTIAGKLTDVPCHTRGLVGPLAEAGVRFLDIGDNGGCKAPEVPFAKTPGAASGRQLLKTSKPNEATFLSLTAKYGLQEKDARQWLRGAAQDPQPYLFNWRDPEGAEIMVLYHPFGDGSTVAIPGTNIAVSIQVRGDNSGPHSLNEIKACYAWLRTIFPRAQIVPTNLSTIAAALEPLRSGLPVVTKEMGDTWIYGVGSDPGKVARYREMCRLRQEWLSKGSFKSGDRVDLALTRKLILSPEHNWGLSVGQYLRHPEVYAPKELADARATMPEFKKMDAGWAEKRADMDRAVSVLPSGLQEEARRRLQTLIPKPPETRGLAPLAPGAQVQGAHFIVSLDPATGSIRQLQDRKTGREWASVQHFLASFRYQTFTSADFGRFNHIYNTQPMGFDFSKPGIEKYPVQSRTWQPALLEAWAGEDAQRHRMVAELRLPRPDVELAGLVSWPERLTMEIGLPKAEPAVHIIFQCFSKLANRLSEAMWLSFSPDAPDEEGWLLEKVDRPVSPHDVIADGGLHLHAVTRKVSYHDAKGSFTLETLDAPLVSPGQRGLLVFDKRQPDMREGVHVNLFNNLWGTAFPQWYGDDMRFRFVIRV
jgi:hypothetical protein